MRRIIRFFAERSMLANVFTCAIILLGLISLNVIKRDNFPSVDFEELTVTTRYTGASSEDVELNVTNKLEKELKEVDAIKSMTSVSMENISIINIQIDPDVAEKDKVKVNIRNAVSRVGDLPYEVDERPVVDEITTTTSIPILEVGLTGYLPYRDLREIAHRMEKELSNVSGVARIVKYGYLDREVEIEVSQNAVEKWRIPTYRIVEALKRRNVRSSGGSFESYANERNIVTLAQFPEPSEVGDVIVHATEEGTLVRVSDLAVLKDDFEAPKVLSRMNGKPAISFLVFKKESADMIRTADAVKSYIADKQTHLPRGVSIEYSNNASRLVSNRLEVLLSNGMMGLVLVLLVLSISLDFRSAVWVAMGILVSLLGTLSLLPVFGAYLDSITLAAMILVIGIIVDDGIIVAENIWRYRELGYSPRDASVEGMVSVFQPVLTTILTTAFAFAPIFFMSGTMGDFVYVIPLVVVLALFISFTELTVALPAHLGSGVIGGLGARRRESGTFAYLQRNFGNLVFRVLQFRYKVILAFFLLLLGSLWYASRYIDFTLFPTKTADGFYMLVELPSGASLEHTSDKIKELEKLLQQLPNSELDSYVTRIGSHDGFDPGESENWASIGVYLTPFSKRERNADEIVESLRRQADSITGIAKLTFIIDSGGPSGGRPVELRVVGSDDQLRSDLASRIEQTLAEIAGVKDIDRDDKHGKEQVMIDLDYIRLAEAGLTVEDVARDVRLAYDGEIVTSVRYGDEDVDFRVILDKRARESLGSLANLPVANAAGRFFQLQDVAKFTAAPGPLNIYHFDNERAITITADIDQNVTTSLQVTRQLLASLDLDNKWPGMQIIIGGEAEDTQESMQSLIMTFVAATAGIYLLLLLLFNSLLQPLVIMVAVSFGLFGVIIAFALHQQSLGFLAMLGVIGLTGIVVNDSLVLVDLVNRLLARDRDKPLETIVVEAAQSRLRPILLTSITTAAGLLPLAYGLGGSDPFSAPMALAVGYGVLFATPLTLLLIPCLLVVLDDFGKVSGIFRIGSLLGRLGLVSIMLKHVLQLIARTCAKS
ncbi:MAG: efflux RND transporter permease subunit [Candidatus Thiodiazotropha sp.]